MRRFFTLILVVITITLLAPSVSAKEVTSLVAYIMPKHQVIRSGIEATVKSVNYKDNQVVAKNELAVTFECSGQKANYAKANEELADAEGAIESADAVKAMKQEDKGFAEHRYEAALLEYSHAKKIVSYCNLSTDMAGSFTSDVTPGESVKKGQVVAIVSKLNQNSVYAIMTFSNLAKEIKVGQIFKYKSSGSKGSVYQATVSSITDHEPNYIAIVGVLKKPFKLKDSRTGSAIFNVA